MDTEANGASAEREMISAAREGDRDAQEEFVKTHYGYVMGYLVKLTLERELAQDLTQETFIRALRALPNWRGESKVGSWLIAIAHNLFRDHMRQSARRDVVPLDEMPLSDAGVGAERMELTAEAREALSMLGKLPPDRREMVVLRYYYGYTSKEIARLMRVPEGTVRSRLHYALKMIAQGRED
jgi:RNA polymerase sigma-70 factor (ECF subfamily)